MSADVLKLLAASHEESSLGKEPEPSRECSPTPSKNGEKAFAATFIALVHHPVYNKNGMVIASALTTIDLHDLARLTATYGLTRFYLVMPLGDQRQVAEEMLEHWRSGPGRTYNPNRSEALDKVILASDIDQARTDILRRTGRESLVVGTTAKDERARTTFGQLRSLLGEERPVLVLFGTAWGLTQEVLAGCDYVLESVVGPTEYNHLSVRSAAGIILDRLLGSQVGKV
jgi:hypothetical protein